MEIGERNLRSVAKKASWKPRVVQRHGKALRKGTPVERHEIAVTECVTESITQAASRKKRHGKHHGM